MEDTPSIQNAGANSLSQDLLGLSLDDKPKKSQFLYDDESSEFEFEFKGEKIFGLGYNV
jgi:hypothetical protein